MCQWDLGQCYDNAGVWTLLNHHAHRGTHETNLNMRTARSWAHYPTIRQPLANYWANTCPSMGIPWLQYPDKQSHMQQLPLLLSLILVICCHLSLIFVNCHNEQTNRNSAACCWLSLPFSCQLAKYKLQFLLQILFGRLFDCCLLQLAAAVCIAKGLLPW